MKRLKNIFTLIIIFFTFNIVITFGNQSHFKCIEPAYAKAARQNIQGVMLSKPAAKKIKTKAHALPSPKNRKASKLVILGSYHTHVIEKDKNRLKNIELAAGKINDYTIRPGQTFSFNKVVGKRTPQKGYKYTKIVVKGKTDIGIGGGICQLSTTLYNAAKRSNLQIIERHSHSKKILYVPHGRDATVDYGYLDLKFKNTKSYPVRIKARLYKGQVQTSIIKVK